MDTGTHRWNTATFGFRATSRRLRRLRLVQPDPRLRRHVGLARRRTIRNPDRTTALVPVRAPVRDKRRSDDSFEYG